MKKKSIQDFMEAKEQKDSLMKAYLRVNKNSSDELKKLQKEASKFTLMNGRDKDILNLVQAVKALDCYVMSDNFDASAELMQPVLKDFKYGKVLRKIKYGNRLQYIFYAALLAEGLVLCSGFNKAIEVSNNLEKWLNAYDNHIPYTYNSLLTVLYINVAERLLYAKYFEENWSESLSKEFDKYIELALGKLRECEWDISFHEISINLRRALFYWDKDAQIAYMQKLKQCGYEDAYKAVELGLKKYNSIKKGVNYIVQWEKA